MILEREEEERVAATLVAGAVAGDGSTLVIEGPAGVGKTTVLSIVAEKGEAAGMRVVSARAVPVEQGEAWAGVRRLFDRVIQRASPRERDGLLSGAAVNATAPLGLELGGATVLDPFTCVHGLYWLVANLTNGGPVLLSVDDAQWLDPPSARWLAHMGSRSSDLPLLLAVARRSGEPAAAEEALAELDGGRPHRLKPRPLSAGGSESFVSLRLPGVAPGRIASACHEATGGNPFLLAELCTALAELGPAELNADHVAGFGPDGVAVSVRERLERLGPDPAAIAKVLSVLGESAGTAEVARMGGVPIERASEAVDALAAAEILAHGEPLQFRHPVLRAAVYESIERRERSTMHREVAAALHESGAGTERVSSHLLRTDPAGDEWVVDRLDEAAVAASERGASEPAAEYLRRALAEPPGGAGGVRLRFRYALARLGQGDRAISDLTRAVLAIPDAERPAAALEASRALGLFTEHAAALEICASVPDMVADPAVASRLSDEVMVNMLPVGPELWRASSPADVLARAPDPPDPGAAALRVVSESLVAVKEGRPVNAERLADAVQGLMSEFPSLAFAAAVLGLVWCDELETAQGMADAGIAYSRSVGSQTGVDQWTSVAASVCLRDGRIREGVAQAAASVEFNSGRPPPTIAWPLAPLIECYVLLGELDLASEAANLVPDRTDGYLSTATLTEAVGRLALARREISRAVRLLEDAGRRFDAMGFAAPPISAWRSSLAEALVAAGEPERAHSLAAAQLEIAERASSPRAVGVAQRALALCGEAGDRLRLLEDSVDTLRASPARIELARSLIALGGELARQGRRRDAREPLTEAMQLAQECGASGIEEQARAELVSTGARPRRRALSGVDSLTPSELRVAHLVAAGMTNREAAQALFLSEKTIEGHLGRIFSKLEITSRTELAAQFRRGPAAPPAAD